MRNSPAVVAHASWKDERARLTRSLRPLISLANAIMLGSTCAPRTYPHASRAPLAWGLKAATLEQAFNLPAFTAVMLLAALLIAGS